MEVDKYGELSSIRNESDVAVEVETSIHVNSLISEMSGLRYVSTFERED